MIYILLFSCFCLAQDIANQKIRKGGYRGKTTENALTNFLIYKSSRQAKAKDKSAPRKEDYVKEKVVYVELVYFLKQQAQHVYGHMRIICIHYLCYYFVLRDIIKNKI